MVKLCCFQYLKQNPVVDWGVGGGGSPSSNEVLKWIREQPVLASGAHFAGPQAIG